MWNWWTLPTCPRRPCGRECHRALRPSRRIPAQAASPTQRQERPRLPRFQAHPPPQAPLRSRQLRLRRPLRLNLPLLQSRNKPLSRRSSKVAVIRCPILSRSPRRLRKDGCIAWSLSATPDGKCIFQRFADFTGVQAVKPELRGARRCCSHLPMQESSSLFPAAREAPR